MPASTEQPVRLTDKTATPDAAMLRDWLGPDGYAYWSALADWIAATYPALFVPDWIFGGARHGWSLRYKKSRAFCTLVPERPHPAAVVVLGVAEQAKVEAEREKLSPRLLRLFDEATTYHDGKWLKIALASPDDVRDATDLMRLKRRPKASR